MTTQIPQFLGLDLAGSEAVLAELTRTMHAMQKAQQGKLRAKKDFQQWRAAPSATTAFRPAPRRDEGMDTMMNMFLGGVLFASIMGPEGLGGMAPMLGMFGALMMQQNCSGAYASEETVAMDFFMQQNMPKNQPKMFSDLTLEAEQAEMMQQMMGTKPNMAFVRQLHAMLAMQVAQQQRDAEQQLSKKQDIVPDVLRKPEMAQFKQNRQSMVCTRTMIRRQTKEMLGAKAPAYKYAA